MTSGSPRADTPPPRLDALDILRGLIMVVMALDHVRDYFSSARFDPVDLTQTTAPYFLTRWITHFCAPGFSFFAGTAAFLSLTRGKSRGEAARFLFTRGLFLILFEAMVLRFMWQFNLLPFTMLVTLFALGASMIVLSALVFLPAGVVGTIGLAMIAAHNLLDSVRAESFGSWAWLWKVVHEGGAIPIGPFFVVVGYPLLPWPGVMAAGYAFGKILTREPVERRKWTFRLGLAATASFVVLRLANVYGDPAPWTRQRSPLFTLFSFLNCEKYPPSLLFLLMTLGPLLMLLAAVDGPMGRAGRVLCVYGRVPMFFYVVHIPFIHVLAILVAEARASSISDPAVMWAIREAPGIVAPPPPGYGFGVPAVYFIWALVVVALYPACRWYGDLKVRVRAPWMTYI